MKRLVKLVSSFFRSNKVLLRREYVLDVEQLRKEWKNAETKEGWGKATDRCLEQTLGTELEQHLTVLTFLGYAYHQMNQYDDALQYLLIAVKQVPNHIQNTYFLASTYESLGLKAEAFRYFVRAWELGAIKLPALNRAIKLAPDLERDDEMVSFTRKLKAHASSDPSKEIHLQTLFFQLKKFDDLSESLATSSVPEEDRSQLRRIVSVQQWTKDNDADYRELGGAESIRISYPSTDGSISEESIVYSNVSYVAELSEATVVGGSSLVFDSRDYVISDTLAHPEYGRFVDLQNDEQVIAQHPNALLVKGGETNNSISKGIMLSGLFSKHFGHWFAEFLPRLSYLEQYPKFSEMLIIVDEGMPASHYDFLNTIAKNGLYRLSKGERLKVGHLLVAPTMTFCPVKLFQNHTIPTEHQGSWTPSALRYLRERVLEHYGKRRGGCSEKIFISRKNSSWRCLLNEDELIGELQPLGFKIICLEEYDFEGQVRIFQNAELIVAPNGSVLNSLIFSDPEVKVLVLSQKEQFNWGGWFGPIMELGYRPVLVTGNCVGVEGKKHGNYTIEVELVLDAVADLEMVV